MSIVYLKANRHLGLTIVATQISATLLPRNITSNTTTTTNSNNAKKTNLSRSPKPRCARLTMKRIQKTENPTNWSKTSVVISFSVQKYRHTNAEHPTKLKLQSTASLHGHLFPSFFSLSALPTSTSYT